MPSGKLMIEQICLNILCSNASVSTCGFVWGALSKFRPFAGLFQLLFYTGSLCISCVLTYSCRVGQECVVACLSVVAAVRVFLCQEYCPSSPRAQGWGSLGPPSSAAEMITYTRVLTYTDDTTRMWSLSNCTQSCELFFMVTSKLPALSACQTLGACRWV